MNSKIGSFSNIFRKFRLRAGFKTLSGFGDELAARGFPFENSLFSHWQKNARIPKDRRLLLTIIDVFLERGGISSIRDVNVFLESANQGNLTERELDDIAQKNPTCFKGLNSSPRNILEFLVSTAKSKKIVRKGWQENKIKDPESVADHSFQLSIVAMIFADHFGVDKEKLMKMAVLHDLGEVITGDIIWTRGNIIDLKKRANKEKAELEGIQKIFKIINSADEYKKLFIEMLEGRTLEAKLFWELDKLEVAIQAMIYEKKHGKRLDEFFISSDLQIHSPFLRKIFKQILKERPKFK